MLGFGPLSFSGMVQSCCFRGNTIVAASFQLAGFPAGKLGNLPPQLLPGFEPGPFSGPAMIRYKCPQCKTLLQSADNQAGSTVACPKCKAQMRVPAIVSSSDGSSWFVLDLFSPHMQAPALASLLGTAPPSVSAMIRYTCPQCKMLLQSADKQAGATVACPKCKAQMRVPALVSAPDGSSWFVLDLLH